MASFMASLRKNQTEDQSWKNPFHYFLSIFIYLLINTFFSARMRVFVT